MGNYFLDKVYFYLGDYTENKRAAKERRRWRYLTQKIWGGGYDPYKVLRVGEEEPQPGYTVLLLLLFVW